MKRTAPNPPASPFLRKAVRRQLELQAATVNRADRRLKRFD